MDGWSVDQVGSSGDREETEVQSSAGGGGDILSTRRHEKSTWCMASQSVFDRGVEKNEKSDVNGVAGKRFIQYYAVFRPANRR